MSTGAMRTRRCFGCGLELELTEENFAPRKHRLSRTCKPCLLRQQREQRERALARRVSRAVQGKSLDLALTDLQLPQGRASVAKRRAWEADAHYQYIVAAESPTSCLYCGEHADTVDHVTPIVYAAALLFSGMRLPELLKGPACRECNLLVGSTVFESFEDRLAYLKTKLIRRYAKELSVPAWSAEELRELGGRTRVEVTKASSIGQRVRARVKWCPSVSKVVSPPAIRSAV